MPMDGPYAARGRSRSSECPWMERYAARGRSRSSECPMDGMLREAGAEAVNAHGSAVSFFKTLTLVRVNYAPNSNQTTFKRVPPHDHISIQPIR